MTSDAETLTVYNLRAAEYAEMAVDPEQNTMLKHFVAAMPQNARVLDYGCGPGHAAAEMQRRGLIVNAFDASAEMVAIAQNAGVDARLKSFDEMKEVNAYQGVWASFSLLHAAKSEFPTLLRAIRRALVPGGLLILAMKLGQGEERDQIGRYYAYYSQSELNELLIDAGFKPTEAMQGESIGLAGKSAPFIVVTARA